MFQAQNWSYGIKQSWNLFRLNSLSEILQQNLFFMSLSQIKWKKNQIKIKIQNFWSSNGKKNKFWIPETLPIAHSHHLHCSDPHSLFDLQSVKWWFILVLNFCCVLCIVMTDLNVSFDQGVSNETFHGLAPEQKKCFSKKCGAKFNFLEGTIISKCPECHRTNCFECKVRTLLNKTYEI